METKEKYSELEKKVIEQGFLDFRKELEEASLPMGIVLRKYNLYKYGKVLQKICLRCPFEADFYVSAVHIPDNDSLTELEPLFLDMFLKDIDKLKKTVDNLHI